MTLRVLIADDQDTVRTGLTMLLDAQPGIEVIGAATDRRQAVRLARQLRPDVRRLAAFARPWTGPPAQPVDPLTAREEEVLVLVARGRTNDEDAAELHVSTSAAKTHVASLMRKLGARTHLGRS